MKAEECGKALERRCNPVRNGTTVTKYLGSLQGIAGLWAAAAWAEGHEHLAEWVFGLVNAWICDLALVTDRVQKEGEISRRDVVKRLQELGEKAQKRGERSLAVMLHATALAIVNGLETEVAERTVVVVCERALEHMEAHVRDEG